MNKHQIEALLAEKVTNGIIVEIGVGEGAGTLQLVAGSNQGRKPLVYCIDDFTERTDVMGSHSGTENRNAFLTRLAGSGVAHRVRLLEADPIALARSWRTPVGLLYIDRSFGSADLTSVVAAWEEHVVPGGLIGLAGQDHIATGAEDVATAMVGTARFESPSEYGHGPVAVLRKLPPSRAAFWIVDGPRYVEEAARSARSVKSHLQLTTMLFGTEAPPAGLAEPFDAFVQLPPRRHSFWYLDSTEYFIGAVNYLAGLWPAPPEGPEGGRRTFDQLLYLDTDTYVCAACEDLWDLLLRYDMAMGQSPQRDAIESAAGTPPSFTTMSIGVNLFRNNARVRALLYDWLQRYRSHAQTYGDNDQAPLRDALWENPHGVQWMALPPEYTLRFDFGCWVVGKVRILHGRPGGKSQEDPAAVCEEINSTGRMRLWNHGLVPKS